MTTTSLDERADEIQFLGARARVLTTGDETAGGLGLVDMIEVPAGEMPPLHVHHSHDEGFYVVEGHVSVFLPGREVALGPGDFFLAPRGVPHTYRVGDEPARWLVSSVPSGFERFVTRVAELEEPDPARLAAIGADYDIEILGPPGLMP